jgi:hypothetical protein
MNPLYIHKIKGKFGNLLILMKLLSIIGERFESFTISAEALLCIIEFFRIPEPNRDFHLATFLTVVLCAIAIAFIVQFLILSSFTIAYRSSIVNRFRLRITLVWLLLWILFSFSLDAVGDWQGLVISYLGWHKAFTLSMIKTSWWIKLMLITFKKLRIHGGCLTHRIHHILIIGSFTPQGMAWWNISTSWHFV